ncbi:ubiquinone biosynthesis protein [Grosmannia clavigera kw1407]|uniref:Ubiquinone biosynthesis protein n=1 Tax=Grosmannia clavigera (strain kw1407 / UAMH 11150) TaxID=655863 RepID=F0XFS5_GROCL|nr:ubiquinone biosynthesis protein [Grosmannia clavigera kw1407]EFX03895.1 ubiquinone biosynthesis protein [Grosmannia clavigera kw1407]
MQPTFSFFAAAFGRQSGTMIPTPGVRGWACARCRNSQLARSGSRAFRLSSGLGARTAAPPPPSGSTLPRSSRRRRRAIILTASGGAAATGVLAFTDDIRQGYETAERAGRVATALMLCINDYRTTLKQRDKLDDDEVKTRLLKVCHQRCADRTLRVLEKCGGIFIKLGQHLSAMNYLLPIEWTSTFVPLQDRCPVSSLASIEAMYRADTGTELWETFSDFAPEPVGAASLAQVHLATLRSTGERVAVKLQHPGLAEWVQLDMSLTAFTFATLKRFFPEYDLEWLSAEVAASLPQELDFRREAHNAARTRDHFAALQPQLPLLVPAVLWARERILVMACEPGHRLDDLAYLDDHGIDRDAVSAALAHVFNEMIFREGVPLHCDPHGGNLAVRAKSRGLVDHVLRRPNFDIILYDHGLYRDIPLALRRSYAHMWLAVLDGDMDSMQRYAHDVAGIDEAQFPLFASAITGRDISVLRSASILSPRTAAEKDQMGGQLQEGLLANLVQLLGRVPRVILLILKTNDLTRSLDEGLHTRRGPVQSFLIMAQYCLRTVFYEQLDNIRAAHGSLLWPTNSFRLLAACLSYLHGRSKLELLDLWLTARRLAGFQTDLGSL